VTRALAALQVASEHLALQDMLLGSMHCDAAATLDVLQQTLQYLIGRHPQELYAAFPDTWSTFAKASKAQYAYQKRYGALRKLYASTNVTATV
jgi:hypothetical protein